MRTLTIEIAEDMTGFAPKDSRYQAYWHDIDLDRPYGSGATEEDAIIDLISNVGLPA